MSECVPNKNELKIKHINESLAVLTHSARYDLTAALTQNTQHASFTGRRKKGKKIQEGRKRRERGEI